MSTCHHIALSLEFQGYTFHFLIFFVGQYYDERKPIDKHVLKFSHLGEMSISTVFSVVTTNNIAHVILF